MRAAVTDMKEEEYQWLSVMSTHFNINYNKTRWYEHVVTSLKKEYGVRMEKEVRCLVTNMARAMKIGAVGMRIPRGRNHFTFNSQGISHTRMIKLLDQMEEDGFVDLYIGGVKVWRGGEPVDVVQSITVMKDRMTNMMKGVDFGVVLCHNTGDEVEIKERGTKKVMSTQGVRGVEKLRKTVFEFNSALVASRISLKGINLPSQHYKRVFIENLENGGRWYNSSGGVQTMDRTLRPFLRIDDEELVELDYKAMHAGILYEQAGAELPEDFDPYGVEIFENYFDAHAIDQFKKMHGLPSYRPDRNLIKMMVLIGLNAKGSHSAAKAIAQKVGEDRKKVGRVDEHKCEYFGLVGEDFSDIYKSITEHNSLIAHHFFSDCGIYLQNVDSEILEYVICDILAQGEICLPWHDGLMVKKRHGELVKQSMYSAWKRKLGTLRFCKVEEV